MLSDVHLRVSCCRTGNDRTSAEVWEAPAKRSLALSLLSSDEGSIAGAGAAVAGAAAAAAAAGVAAAEGVPAAEGGGGPPVGT